MGLSVSYLELDLLVSNFISRHNDLVLTTHVKWDRSLEDRFVFAYSCRRKKSYETLCADLRPC